jgi:hypothetical protein
MIVNQFHQYQYNEQPSQIIEHKRKITTYGIVPSRLSMNNYKPKIDFRKRTKRRSSKSEEHNSILRKQMLKTKQKTSANSHKSHKWNNVLWIIWKNDNHRIIWIMT